MNSNGRVASVQHDRSNFVGCVKSSFRGSFESFQLINNSDGTISLKSNFNGLYVCADSNKSNHLIARSKEIYSWEKFRPITSSKSSSLFFLQSLSNEKYVISDKSALKASSESAKDSFSFYPVDDESKGTFNLRTKKIHFKGKTYRYDDEFIRTGNSALESELKFFDQGENYRVYPQGIEYCKNLVLKQKDAQRTLIILGKFNNEENCYTLFYFASKNICDFCCDQGFRVFGNAEFDKEIDLLNQRKNGFNFPQSWKYCLRLLEKQKEIGGCVRIIVRNEKKPAFYFFKVDTEDDDEKLLLKCENEFWYENEKLNDVLLRLDKEKNDIFPQGFDYCRSLVIEQRDGGGRIHTLVSQTSPKTHFYYTV